MGNFYAFDVIKTKDGQYKFFDFQGTSGGGLSLINYCYGNADRAVKFLRHLHREADNKTIVIYNGLKHGGLNFIPNNDFTRAFAHLNPTTHWVYDQLDRQQRRRNKKVYDFKKTRHILHKALRDCPDIEVIFCNYLKEENGQYIAKGAWEGTSAVNSNKRDILLNKQDIGIIYNTGDSWIGELDLNGIKQVNSPIYTDLFVNKMIFRYLLENTEVQKMIPDYMYVGMGTSTRKEISDFLDTVPDSTPSVVLKPILGARSVGVHFHSKEQIEEMFKLNVAEGKYNFDQLEELIDNPLVYIRWRDLVEIEQPFFFNDLMWDCSLARGDDMDYFELTDDDLDHNIKFLNKARKEKDLTKIAYKQFNPHPLIDYYISLLEEYVEPELYIAGDGKGHQGYIRVVAFDKQIIGAFYRFPIEEYSGKFINLNLQEVRTDFEAVDSKTEDELSALMEKFITVFEDRLSSEVSSQEDLKRIRTEILKSHWKRA